MTRAKLTGGWETKTAIKIVKAQSGLTLTVRQLQAWHRKRVVVAEMQDRRRTRLYGFQGIRRLCIVARLLKANLSPHRLGEAIRNIDRAETILGKAWDQLRIVTDGRSIFVVNGDKGIEAISGQVVSFILLGDLHEKARSVCEREASKMRSMSRVA